MAPNFNNEIKNRIVLLHEQGLNISEISRELNIPRKALRRWITRHGAEGRVVQRPRPGRPLLLGDQRQLVVDFQKCGFQRASQYAVDLNVSVETIRRTLLNKGFPNRQ
ncbi:hypothetical protein ABEB36_015243 [Hypothenemus hampei]|uniref:Transposase n=1 Tax=Hypothenemus hampei TaxID=57062 RepID=A0ABD1E149_HYPHA